MYYPFNKGRSNKTREGKRLIEWETKILEGQSSWLWIREGFSPELSDGSKKAE